ncbi:hypothetical protein PQR46_18675 [Paraburkholderia sediminicola]|uniref:hypothetical protein n=1 Tax=Paraburkholderia sediminicola TaxID=458836 RepID=UPI0038BBDE33
MTISISDIAGIIQGMGSLVAIGVAIWIYARQYRDKKADDKAETAAFVQAIRDEIHALLGLYEHQIGPALRSLEPGKGFHYFYPVSADALTIYNSASSRVGKVTDPKLRRLIVQTYALAKGIISSYQMNNQLLADNERLALTYHENDREDLLVRREQGLAEYAGGLKEQDERLSQSVKELLEHAERWLTDHAAVR